MFGLQRLIAPALAALVLLLAVAPGVAADGAPGAPAATHQHAHKSFDLGSGAAISADGTLWAVMKETVVGDSFIVLRTSSDKGESWSAPRRVLREPEPIGAN